MRRAQKIPARKRKPAQPAPRKRARERIGVPTLIVVVEKARGASATVRARRARAARTLRAARKGGWSLVTCAPHEAARIMARRRRVALIAGESEIAPASIAAAFRALAAHKVAIGPRADGGFWIVAARNGREAAQALSRARDLDDLLGRFKQMPARVRGSS